MKSNIDFGFLKNTLIFLGIALVLALVFIFAGIYFEQTKYDEYKKAKVSLAKSHRKYKKLVEDLDLLELYRDSYKHYTQSGLIGPERRLTWIETLESLNDELKLPKLTYSLSPQEEFKRPLFTVDAKIRVLSTPMKMEIDLLHEEDLFDVFGGIDARIQNLFTIDECRIRRKSKSSALLNTRSANLISSCLMRWITVDVQDK